MADTKRKLENDVFAAAGIAQKNNCALTRLDYQQEAGLMSSVPLGENLIPIQRGLSLIHISAMEQYGFTPDELDAALVSANADLHSSTAKLDRKSVV